MSWVAVAIGGSAVAGLYGASQSAKAANKATQAQVGASQAATDAELQAQKEALALQKQQYANAFGLNAPTIRDGRRAQAYIDAILYGDAPATAITTHQATTSGPTSGWTPAAQPVATLVPDWNAYAAADPGIAREYERSRSGKGAGQFASLADYAQWHYENLGKAEGRALPTMADPSSPGPQTSIGGQDYSDLYAPVDTVRLGDTSSNATPSAGTVMASYRATPFATMSEEAITAQSAASDLATRKAVEEFMHRAGANGGVLSGNAIRGEAELRNEFGVANAVDAATRRAATFGNWYDNLAGEAATGRGAVATLSGAGSTFAGNAGDLALAGGRSAAENALRIADAQSRGSKASADAWGAGINSAVAALGTGYDIWKRGQTSNRSAPSTPYWAQGKWGP